MPNLIRRFIRAISTRKLTGPVAYVAPTAKTEAYFDHERVTLPPPGGR